MKNLITIAFVFFTVSFALAQDFEISEAPRAIGNGTYNSFLVELPDVDKKTAEDEWKKFMKDFKGKSKYDKKSKLWNTESAKIGQLSNNPLKVQAMILEDNNPDKKTSVIVWFEMENGFVNTADDSKKGMNAYDILTEFARSVSKSNAQSNFKEQEKLLSSLEKDLKKLEKENKNLNQEIEKAKKLIDENENNIEANIIDQKNKKREIEEQAKALREAKSNVKKFN